MLPVLPTSRSIVQQQQQQQNHHLVDNSRAHSQSPTPRSPTNKRNASMIFRIEHLLPQAAAATTTATVPVPGSSSPSAPTSPHSENNGTSSAACSSPKKSKIIRAGVHVTQLIPKDTTSILIDSHALLAAGTTEVATEPLARAYCSLSPKGDTLILNASIMRKIKLSEDIHSYNALFELQHGQVQLRVVRDIQRDEEIVAWFGEELTLLMAIPFLTPLNIQGNNRYMCHWCHLTFETPNPLKIHLALGCGRHNIDVLWIRLHYALRAKQYSQQLFTLPLVSSSARSSPIMVTTTTTASGNPITLQTTSSSTMRNVSPTYSPPATQTSSPPSPPPAPRFSAFKPISLAAHTHHQHPVTSLPVSLTSAPHLHTSTAAHSMSFLPSLSSASFPPHMSLLHPSSSTNPLNAAAQIEAIVSNMGASKQGHLCIYCGKMYSRKYGLKIHIRTHTGFKPLKCKYCLRPFGDPSNLNKHIRLHLQSSGSGHGNGAEVYQCTLCHKSFGRRRDLQKHVENRHGEAASGDNKMESSHSD
ncbi:sal-like protein 3 [Musca vetustissima]|uniref:sal-like protein 3 n=1 Tax=Musca vetustissima TaxID=27455 RepID=UPI002AB7D177|nr:sal-like protein 3 [Musca vetustissima]